MNQSTIETEIKNIYNEGIALFNDGNCTGALEKFEDMLAAQLIMLPPDHPDVVKTEKSILMVKRRMVTHHEKDLNTQYGPPPTR